MSNVWTIARRELASYFFSPIAYVVLCLFALLAGIFFLFTGFTPGEPAEMRRIFLALVWILVPTVPAISMRLLAEEQRSGTIETLLTSPVSDLQVIVGKWLGALGFFVVLLLPTLVFVILLEVWGDPDYGPIVSGYLGLLFVGGLYLAIGTFASGLTRNQIIAFLVAVFTILLFTVVTFFLPRVVPPFLAAAMFYLNVNEQYGDFSRGLVDISNLVFFLSGIVLFLTLAVKALESRRWR